MSVFLVNENKPTPITLELQKQGAHLIKNEWHPDIAQLRAIDGCLVSFYDCFTKPFRIMQLKRRLSSFGIPLIAWNRDAPSYLNKKRWRLEILNRIQLLDIYLSHAFPDSYRFAPSSLLMQNAANQDVYNITGTTFEELRDVRNYAYDVSFFGVIKADRIKEYLYRQRFIYDLQENLEALGINTCFIDTQKKTLSHDQQIKIIRKSRININVGAGCEPDGIGWGLPERCFGIPAAGGFLLSDARFHAVDSFRPQQEWVEFSGVKDAIEKIRYFLSNLSESRDIAEAAHARVMAEHTYAHRAHELIAIVQRWRNARTPC